MLANELADKMLAHEMLADELLADELLAGELIRTYRPWCLPMTRLVTFCSNKVFIFRLENHLKSSYEMSTCDVI